MGQPSSDERTAREALIRRYLPLVRRIAGAHSWRLPSGVDLDDVRSWGVFGLLAAVDRFDPARAELFVAYARKRIRGAILDQLRQSDWTPRSVRDKAEAVARGTREVEARLGRAATEDDIASALGLPIDAYRALIGRIAPVAVVSLEDVRLEQGERWQGGLPDHGAEPFDAILRREEARLLADAIRGLPEREQLLLSLYYRDELTLKEVGAVLGVTESRVCQLHAQALRGLRARLKPGGETTDGKREGPWGGAADRMRSATASSGRGGSRAFGIVCAPANTGSMRTPRPVPCSRRFAVSDRV